MTFSSKKVYDTCLKTYVAYIYICNIYICIYICIYIYIYIYIYISLGEEKL